MIIVVIFVVIIIIIIVHDPQPHHHFFRFAAPVITGTSFTAADNIAKSNSPLPIRKLAANRTPRSQSPAPVDTSREHALPASLLQKFNRFIGNVNNLVVSYTDEDGDTTAPLLKFDASFESGLIMTMMKMILKKMMVVLMECYYHTIEVLTSSIFFQAI